MRRSRGQTIEASNFDELLKLSQIPTMTAKFRARKSLPESSLLPQFHRKTSLTSDRTDSMIKKLQEEAEPVSTTGDYWDDMDFDSHDQTTASRSITSINKSPIGTHTELCHDSDSDDDEERGPVVTQHQLMIIGARGTGRHMLVDKLLEPKGSGEGERHDVRTAFDLAVKKRQGADQNSREVFKFWMKDAENRGFTHFFKIYYKAVDTYVFLYQVDDKKSFECLEKAINEVKQERKGQKFTGILVGGKSKDLAETKREVTLEEAQEFQKKHELSKFVEEDFESGNEIKIW